MRVADNRFAMRAIFSGHYSIIVESNYKVARNGAYILYASQPRRKNQKDFRRRQVFCRCLVKDNAAEETLLAKEALVEAIRNAGLSVHSYPERKENFAEKWRPILPSANNNHLTFSTSILIPKNKNRNQRNILHGRRPLRQHQYQRRQRRNIQRKCQFSKPCRQKLTPFFVFRLPVKISQTANCRKNYLKITAPNRKI